MSVNGRKIILVISLILLLILLVGGFFSYRIYSRIYISNVDMGAKEYVYLHIPTGSSYAQVVEIIEDLGCITNMSSFKWTSSRMGYPYSVKAGRYRINSGMNNKDLVTMLRAGLQTPVKVTFNSFRTPSQLAQRIAQQLEADSAEIAEAFKGNSIPLEYGFTQQTFVAMFVPNTYEFFWNTGKDGFFARMKKEFDAFWNSEREKRAKAMGLKREEVVTLASIVEEETVRADERPRVAGVYINRLKRGMPLQADPTIKFAHGDFGMRRVLTKHLTIDSPYNTYKHRGLPPGPINSPSISSIDAVLNYETHKFLYFCARPDYSGYHAFATNLDEHNRNAREYQRFLNRERIYR